MYKTDIDKDQLFTLSKELKSEKWYTHFWRDAVNHGLSLGIPLEQLDFVIE